MSDITMALAVRIDAKSWVAKSDAALEALTITVNAYGKVNREQARVIRVQTGMLAAQYSHRGLSDSAIARKFGMLKPNGSPSTTPIPHLVALGTLALPVTAGGHGLDPNGELVKIYSGTVRASGDAYAMEKRYILGTGEFTGRTFQPEVLSALMKHAGNAKVDRDTREAGAFIVAELELREDRKAAAKAKRDAAPQVGEDDDVAGDVPVAGDTTAIMLQHIASIANLMGEEFDRASVLSALAGLSTRMMANAPAVEDRKVA